MAHIDGVASTAPVSAIGRALCANCSSHAVVRLQGPLQGSSAWPTSQHPLTVDVAIGRVSTAALEALRIVVDALSTRC